jgi:Flp pilus assembly pilin Flp
MSARFLACARTRLTRIRRNEAGQSTAEYALVILGAVAIATLLITWATGSHAISQLFDSVIQKILPS